MNLLAFMDSHPFLTVTILVIISLTITTGYIVNLLLKRKDCYECPYNPRSYYYNKQLSKIEVKQEDK